ncbi:uncharacterized protein [Procambarus clarkii]|uniref:uncharacterized protein n=1 Tax=Procambarus clarkii TaxID=6728 RepID=UPI003742F6AE
MTRKALFILILATAKGQMMDLFHRDLVALGAACSSEGFCNGSDYHSRGTGFLHYYQSKENCNCDDLCAEYGNCCPDSIYYRWEDQVLPARYKCVSVVGGSVYMKSVCMSGWEDEEVAQLCLAGSPADISNSRDPLAHLPATSNTTSVTYTNYYCAVCNNDSHHLTLWKTQLDCVYSIVYHPGPRDNLTNYITSQLLFNNGSWGSFIPINGRQIFKKCNNNIKRPDIPVNTMQCDATIRTCAENWTDASVADLCHSYTAVRYVGLTAYRNPHCLLCNWINLTLSSCNLFEYIVRSGTPRFSGITDFNYHSDGNIVAILDRCQPSEVYDNYFKKCRTVFRRNDNNLTTNTPDSSACHQHNTRKAFHTDIVNPESNETLNCDKILLCEGEFTLDEKRMVIVEAYARSYQVGEYEVNEGGVLVCIPEELSHKFSPLLGWVSLAGLGLSCLCLLLHLAIFLLLSRLRNLPGKCLASLCLSLLTAYTIFILNTFLEPWTTGCYISAVLMYYSFLAAFCWMNIMTFDVWLTFQQAKDELRVSSGKQRSKFLFYCVYGWLLPALAVVVTVTLDMTAPAGLSPQFLPSFGQRWCWFGKRKALLVFFGAPLFTVMTLNVVFFLIT